MATQRKNSTRRILMAGAVAVSLAAAMPAVAQAPRKVPSARTSTMR